MLRPALAALLALLLTGCAHDYAQHSDRVAYSHGDAVRANIELQTENPARASSYSTRGLGQNGVVVPANSGGEQ